MTIRQLAVATTALLLVHCTARPEANTDASGDGSARSDAGDSAGPDTAAGKDARADTGRASDGTAAFVARGSIGQVFVTHAAPQQALALRNADGAAVAQGAADKWGSLVFRKVVPGQGYRVHSVAPAPAAYSSRIDVIAAASSLPPPSFYADQKILSGTGYLKTRDGTTLAYFATLPGPADAGPYPTIVNYSGYDPARPGKALVSGDQASLCDVLPVLCNAPSDASAMVAAVAGYATVSVNIRGTGCSGGAYDYFEELQLLDGYDVIETVAAQPWVAHHKVGMTGLSYPGITQLFVARMRPPGLAAITPLSVIGNTATTLVPGGILNSGFALNWISHVFAKAAPYGQGWEQAQVDKGDVVCKENQLLHDQRVNNVEQAKNPAYYKADVIVPLNPSAWAGEIQVPVFLACAWQDEQTGPFFHTLLDQFKAAPNRRFIVYNGVHSDGFAPQVMAEWKAFLDLYVARKKPSFPAMMGVLIPNFTTQVFAASLALPPDRWTAAKSWEEAKAAWEKEPELQVIFENGALAPLGAPQGHFTLSFAGWPAPQVKAQRWYFGAEGALLPSAPTATAAASRFALDPKAGERGLGASNLWKANAQYDWKPPLVGHEAAFVTAPLEQDLVMLGTGSVDLYVRTTATDVTDADLEVNLSEVRPDGQERYVQSGWLRASYRKLTPASTELWPQPTLLGADAVPLPVGTWQLARVGLAGFAHPFRKGSRIRIAVDTPGDSRVDWRFDLLPFPHPVAYDIAHTAAYPSSVALPVLAGVEVPAGKPLPPCPSLRGQQCRPYVALDNVPAKF
ncbi:MAG: CocE/NonD family hydrolase [Myxococcales bacterium]|nr:CocE/NonD family hydrolase [Myxococcales bacterium]